ncbi:MAG: hypothetical protein Q9181_007760 [Wetmoreana brouardii]
MAIPSTEPNTTPPEKKGKMSSPNTDELVKFLISCIRHGVNGKIDFESVAGECGIVSKGAAAKRYERLLKANNILPAAAINPRDASVASVKRNKPTTTIVKDVKAAAEKKRKAIEGDNSPANNDDDDDEEPSPATAKKKRVKTEKKETSVKSEPFVKSEDEQEHQSGAEPTSDRKPAGHIKHAILPLPELEEGERRLTLKDKDYGYSMDGANDFIDPALKVKEENVFERFTQDSDLVQLPSTSDAAIKAVHEGVLKDPTQLPSTSAPTIKAEYENVIIVD